MSVKKYRGRFYKSYGNGKGKKNTYWYVMSKDNHNYMFEYYKLKGKDEGEVIQYMFRVRLNNPSYYGYKRGKRIQA